MKSVSLTVGERIALAGLLPQQGDIMTLRLVRDLQMELALKEGEREEFDVTEVKTPDGQTGIRWNPEKTRKYELDDNTAGIIIQKLKEMNDKKALEYMHISLYEKFVEGKQVDKTT